MADIFSSRELATGIWLLAIVFLLLVNEKIRKSARHLVKTALSKYLVIPFVFMSIYAGGFTLFLTGFSFWRWVYLKDILLWFILVGVPTCFNAINKENQRTFYREVVLSNIKLSVIVLLLISTFTFHIAVELVLVPLFTFLALCQAVAETKEELKSVKTAFSTLLFIATVVLLIFTVREAIEVYRDVEIVDLIVSFGIPLLFSILFLPIAYLFAVIAKYQTAFAWMRFIEKKEAGDKRKYRARRRKVIRTCKLSHQAISHFQQNYSRRIYIGMKEIEFDELIYSFKERSNAE